MLSMSRLPVGACLAGSYILFSRRTAAAVHVYICTAAPHVHVSLMLLRDIHSLINTDLWDGTVVKLSLKLYVCVLVTSLFLNSD